MALLLDRNESQAPKAMMPEVSHRGVGRGSSCRVPTASRVPCTLPWLEQSQPTEQEEKRPVACVTLIPKSERIKKKRRLIIFGM